MLLTTTNASKNTTPLDHQPQIIGWQWNQRFIGIVRVQIEGNYLTAIRKINICILHISVVAG